jgi:hypothetical protein
LLEEILSRSKREGAKDVRGDSKPTELMPIIKIMIELTIRLQIAYCFVLPAIEENILNSHLKQRLTTIFQQLKIESLIGIGVLGVSHNHFPYLCFASKIIIW